MTNKDQWKNIIEHQVKMILKEKGLKRSDLDDKEYLNYRYQMAINLLVELG